MKTNLLVLFVSQLLSFLSPEMIKNTINSALEFLEDKVNATNTELDNAAVIPVIRMIRTTLGIIDTNSGNYHEVKTTTGVMITNLLTSLFTVMPPEMIKGFIDQGLDVVENMIQASETTMDDSLILPIIVMIRTTFDIPDNDVAPAVVPAPSVD
jgi:uncharacterized membrane protein